MEFGVNKFLDYVASSPTAFHAVREIEKVLSDAGYEPLSEAEAWRLKPGDRRYVTRNGSALIAFRVPEKVASFRVAAAHTDSPTLKLKERAEDANEHYVRLNVEKYGGLILSTWLDRPLSVAGRVIVREGNGLRTKLVDLGRDAVLIPNVPIHFNREVNDGYKFNPQVDMLPLYADGAGRPHRRPGVRLHRPGRLPDAAGDPPPACAWPASSTTRRSAAAPSRARTPPSWPTPCAASSRPWAARRST